MKPFASIGFSDYNIISSPPKPFTSKDCIEVKRTLLDNF